MDKSQLVLCSVDFLNTRAGNRLVYYQPNVTDDIFVITSRLVYSSNLLSHSGSESYLVIL